MVEQAGLPQTGFVHTRPPPGRPFLLVGFVIPANPPAPLPPAKTRCARLSGLRQRASASVRPRPLLSRPEAGRDRDADPRRARAVRWLRTGREKGARSDASPAGSRGAI